jgi:hypothetical protein
MNWRRGILLAAINLAAVIPMMVQLEMRDAKSLETRPEERALALRVSESGELTEADKGETIAPAGGKEAVAFEPCAMFGGHDPAQVYVVRFGSLPSFVVTGWRLGCPAKWTVSGLIQGVGFLTPKRVAAQRRVDVLLCGLMAVQWVVVGGSPLTKRRGIWQEPDLLITVCTATGCLLALVPVVGALAKLPALVAGCAWFWWAGLVVWTVAQSGRRRLIQHWSRTA